jgi:hypothetical protein
LKISGAYSRQDNVGHRVVQFSSWFQGKVRVWEGDYESKARASACLHGTVPSVFDFLTCGRHSIPWTADNALHPLQLWGWGERAKAECLVLTAGCIGIQDKQLLWPSLQSSSEGNPRRPIVTNHFQSDDQGYGTRMAATDGKINRYRRCPLLLCLHLHGQCVNCCA